jgi:hypothetical protein
MAAAINNLQRRSGNELVNLLRQLHWCDAIFCARDNGRGNSDTIQDGDRGVSEYSERPKDRLFQADKDIRFLHGTVLNPLRRSNGAAPVRDVGEGDVQGSRRAAKPPDLTTAARALTPFRRRSSKLMHLCQSVISEMPRRLVPNQSA